MSASGDATEPVPVPATLAYHSLPADLDLAERVQAAAATGFGRLALSSRSLKVSAEGNTRLYSEP